MTDDLSMAPDFNTIKYARTSVDTERVFPVVPPSLSRALALLLQAHAYAHDAQTDLWQFAIRAEHLHEAGATINDLRWLAVRGYVEHGEETTRRGNAVRSFKRRAGTYFAPKTCFVLTPAGIDLSSTVLPASAVFRMASDSPTIQPRWEAIRRELWLGDVVVKRLRVPAQNQECVLAAFEEENWPEHIDDPLPVHGDVDPKRRLHDVINRLNRSQIQPLIGFHGNGNGQGIYWRLRSC
ncbi:MAG TPA: hypothetical protein P5307_17635 [Pirellulaceae bacterium]|nr:hypothetical protein [Pirellulaceae bacterium]